MSRERLCRCGDRWPQFADGLWHCGNCGDLTPDPRDAFLLDALDRRIDRKLARLREQAPFASNGDGPDPKPLRLAHPREEAAEMLGMSLDSFERYVQPDVKLVRRGRLRVVPHSELERWVEQNAKGVLDDAA
jgi:hypothetical protein